MYVDFVLLSSFLSKQELELIRGNKGLEVLVTRLCENIQEANSKCLALETRDKVLAKELRACVNLIDSAVSDGFFIAKGFEGIQDNKDWRTKAKVYSALREDYPSLEVQSSQEDCQDSPTFKTGWDTIIPATKFKAETLNPVFKNEASNYDYHNNDNSNDYDNNRRDNNG